jgi:hypothetical protein
MHIQILKWFFANRNLCLFGGLHLRVFSAATRACRRTTSITNA